MCDLLIPLHAMSDTIFVLSLRGLSKHVEGVVYVYSQNMVMAW